MVQDTAHALVSAAAPYFEAAAPAVIGYLTGRGAGALIRGRHEGTTATDEWNASEARSLGRVAGVAGVALGVGNYPEGIGPSEIDAGMQLLGAIGAGTLVGDGLGRLIGAELSKEHVAQRSAQAGRIGRMIGGIGTPATYLAAHYLSQRL